MTFSVLNVKKMIFLLANKTIEEKKMALCTYKYRYSFIQYFFDSDFKSQLLS